MDGIHRFCRLVLLVTLLGASCELLAQDAPDASAPAGNAAPNAASNAASIQPTQDTADLSAEVEQLRSEVDRLKQQVAALNSLVEQLQNERTTAAKPAVKPNAKSAKKNTGAAANTTTLPTVQANENVTKTVLVFHDGHKVEATNYAIVGQTLWIYTEQDSKKMPLSDLDVTATKSANSDRGITFQLPPTK